jgi:prophage maintenance system killer protein
MAAAIVFLRLNGVEPKPDSSDWEALVLEVAASRLDRTQTTKRLKKLLR